MSKNSKDIIGYVLNFIFICIVPFVFFIYLSRDSDEVFYERISEDHEICRERAKEDSVDTRWCDEITKAAKLAYRQSSRGSDNSFLIMLFSPLLFALVISVAKLKKQVKELKEKIDA